MASRQRPNERASVIAAWIAIDGAVISSAHDVNPYDQRLSGRHSENFDLTHFLESHSLEVLQRLICVEDGAPDTREVTPLVVPTSHNRTVMVHFLRRKNITYAAASVTPPNSNQTREMRERYTTVVVDHLQEWLEDVATDFERFVTQQQRSIAPLNRILAPTGSSAVGSADTSVSFALLESLNWPLAGLLHNVNRRMPVPERIVPISERLRSAFTAVGDCMLSCLDVTWECFASVCDCLMECVVDVIWPYFKIAIKAIGMLILAVLSVVTVIPAVIWCYKMLIEQQRMDACAMPAPRALDELEEQDELGMGHFGYMGHGAHFQINPIASEKLDRLERTQAMELAAMKSRTNRAHVASRSRAGRVVVNTQAYLAHVEDTSSPELTTDDVAIDFDSQAAACARASDFYSPAASFAISSKAAKKKTKKKKKKKKNGIDNVFADLENVFNGLAACVVHFEPQAQAFGVSIKRSMWILCVCIPMMFVSYSLVACFTLLIILPTIFVLLLVRAGTIEKKVETGFQVRQEVLATETKVKKTFRVFSLLTRAIPMVTYLIAWPVVAIYVLIPQFESPQLAVFLSIGGHLVVLMLFQVLGAYRSFRSYQEKRKAALEEGVQAHESTRRVSMLPDPPYFESSKAASVTSEGELQGRRNSETVDDTPPPPHISSITPAFEKSPTASKLPRFSFDKTANWLAVVLLLFDALQLSLLAFQSAIQEDRDNGLAPSGVLDREFIPVIFFSIEMWIPITSQTAPKIYILYAYGAVGLSALLVSIFVFQFLKELRRFGTLKLRLKDQKAANDCFFYSFVGSIIYGHGDIKEVSRTMSVSVSLLSDFMFIIVTQKLMLLLACEYPANQPPFLQIDPTVICWQGDHALVSTVALIAFSYYLPLSAMIAPMFAEAPSPDGTTSKDVSYAKPFLSIITVSKCVMLVAITFFANQDVATSAAVLLGVSCALAIVTYIWHRATQPGEEASVPIGQTQDVTWKLAGLEPAGAGFSNILRCVTFICGAVGALVAMIAFGVFGVAAEERLEGDTKYAVLAAFFILLVCLAVVWYRRWQNSYRLLVDHIMSIKHPEKIEFDQMRVLKEVPTTKSTDLIAYTAGSMCEVAGALGTSKTSPAYRYLRYNYHEGCWVLHEVSEAWVRDEARVRDDSHIRELIDHHLEKVHLPSDHRPILQDEESDTDAAPTSDMVDRPAGPQDDAPPTSPMVDQPAESQPDASPTSDVADRPTESRARTPSASRSVEHTEKSLASTSTTSSSPTISETVKYQAPCKLELQPHALPHSPQTDAPHRDRPTDSLVVLPLPPRPLYLTAAVSPPPAAPPIGGDTRSGRRGTLSSGGAKSAAELAMRDLEMGDEILADELALREDIRKLRNKASNEKYAREEEKLEAEKQSDLRKARTEDDMLLAEKLWMRREIHSQRMHALAARMEIEEMQEEEKLETRREIRVSRREAIAERKLAENCGGEVLANEELVAGKRSMRDEMLQSRKMTLAAIQSAHDVVEDEVELEKLAARDAVLENRSTILMRYRMK